MFEEGVILLLPLVLAIEELMGCALLLLLEFFSYICYSKFICSWPGLGDVSPSPSANIGPVFLGPKLGMAKVPSPN